MADVFNKRKGNGVNMNQKKQIVVVLVLVSNKSQVTASCPHYTSFSK
jgi:hypothetical protein